MKTLQLLIFGGSSLLCGAIFGVTVGKNSALDEQAPARHIRWNSDGSFTTTESGSSGGGSSSEPLSLLVMAAYRTANDAWSYVKNALSSTASSADGLFSSSKSDDGVQRRERSSSLMIFLVSLGSFVLLFKLAETLQSQNRNTAGNGGSHRRDHDDNGISDNIFGRRPPVGYQPQSISPSAATHSQQELCIICTRFPRSCVIAPCGHVATCWDCAERLVEHANQTAGQCLCPICRSRITRFDYIIVA